ncbi:axis inhibitor 1 [Saccoglossus kowalevskii]|uniref:Axis inhibitor 1 n=1 Tax=Saccoglossus kowalevskii TaxID=10224 RepID=B5THK9_SACKO|nr:axis inhibitor 1 [Saccoglossus kowalevskii]ACH73217.1 axis inhibitor protein [Saccoglossus kowalevskii]
MSVEVPQIPVDPGEHYAGDVPTEQRPPVPGEENIETISNDGCSSHSHYSNKTVITKTELTHSPAATPRRSNIDQGKYASLLQYHVQRGVKGTEDIEAPLGFEPEGSASVTPPYTRWAESFRALLDDSEGINLFREFLQQENDEDSLLFWFACQGFRNKLASDPTRAGTGKVIYKNFIKLNGPQTVKLSEQTRNYIAQDLNKTPITPGLFDQAQSEIEDLMRETTYPMFLKSEIYVQYVQNGGLLSPKCESSSSSSNARYPTGYLPTVHEDAELCCDVKSSTSDSEKQVPLTSEMLAATRYARMGIAEHHREGRHLQSTLSKVISPYHPSLASHAPATSTNDSELQSLSSDAISDDTMSLTDSSVDGFPTTRRREQRRRREMRSMNMNMKQNGCIKSFPPFPHSQRRPKEVQPMEPKQFAAILTKKLEDYLKKLEMNEKFETNMRKLNHEVEEENQQLFVPSSAPMVKTLPPQPAKSFPISSDDTTSGVEEDPNSIIEEHFSRVFDSSGKHTPHGYWSPGRHTPKSKSPDRAFRKVNYHGVSQLPPAMLQKLSHQQHKSRHANRDSGTITIYDTETGMAHHHKHHHHHHVHHHTSTKTKHQIEAEATQRSMAMLGVDPAETLFNPKSRPRLDAVNTPVMETVLEPSRHKRESKKSSKKSDASVTSKTTSGVDSGIFEGPVSLPPSDSGSERNRAIMDWIQESEEFTRHQQQLYAEMISKPRDSRHKRPQHTILPSQSPSPSPHRMGSKKPATYGTSRQSSTERPYNVQAAWVKNKPAQPIMQDPSMPVNPPPDPLSVLEEARRRIDDEKKLKHPKAKHQSDASRKERRPSTVNIQSQSSRSATGTPKNIPPEIEQAEEEQKVQQSSNNSTMKKSSRSSKSTSTSNQDSENTVVAYFFCSEPIPYRTSILGKEITLAQFKSLITKKGHYQYVFKKASNEFECGVVHEIICDDSAILPIFEGKIVGKVEKID